MSSILTNTSAMVALQTMKSINKNMGMVQQEISTGKSIANAKDNAAVWAISKVMESDVKGFKGIGDSLALGSSTITVARKASETVTKLLTDIKGKVVAAQEENVDRAKIQTDIGVLRDQISSVVGAAQFNGLNMVAGTEDLNILSSLDRSGGNVVASNITVGRQDLTTGAGTVGTTSVSSVTAYGSVTAPGGSAAATGTTTAAAGKAAVVTFAASAAAGENFSMNVNGSTLNYTSTGTEAATVIRDYFASAINALGLGGISSTTSGNTLSVLNADAFKSAAVSVTSTTDTSLDITSLNGVTATSNSGVIEQRAETIDFSDTAGIKDGDSFKVTVASRSFDYIAGKGETMEDVAKGLKLAIDSNPLTGVSTRVTQDAATGAWSLAVDDTTGGRTLALSVTQDGKASGGLFGLGNIDVTTNAGADSALANIETMINRSIDAAAAFGSAQGRIEIQQEFVSDLSDALKAGIGSMVDADMEETAARLQALQVQQQLGTQALSIANQAPQNILALFR